MTLKFSAFRAVVKIRVRAKFHTAALAVHELSWSQSKKNSEENNTVRRYRSDSILSDRGWCGVELSTSVVGYDDSRHSTPDRLHSIFSWTHHTSNSCIYMQNSDIRWLRDNCQQEIWANAHETRHSISLISYADCLGLSPVHFSENSL